MFTLHSSFAHCSLWLLGSVFAHGSPFMELHSVFKHCLLCIHSPFAHYLFTVFSLLDHCSFTVRSLFVYHSLTACSLFIYCSFTIRSLFKWEVKCFRDYVFCHYNKCWFLLYYLIHALFIALGTKKSRSAVVYGATYSSSDSGFGGTPQSIDSQSLDSLIETSTNVKFSEQQNTTFNTKRLSAALAMFDPVSTDSSENAPDTLIDIREDKMENDHSAVKSWADSAASLQEAFKVDTLISVEESKTTPPVRSRQDSLTSDSSGSDGVPFAKSSRSASFDNVSEKSEEKVCFT